ncbi:NADPH:quinone oxidoreductase family protein [Saccharopolyspora shandongensis]|uniref:quinone oxidoreductase family protein n=1 Tax=Saccharopolyspora shandongensis TaxID=418495 RepID=UPI00343853D6
MRAIQISRYGGPEVLVHEEVPDPAPSNGEVAIRVSAAGVNYMDTMCTANSYLKPVELPYVPGGEVVGRAADGRRVLAMMDGGGYAELVVTSSPFVAEVPDGVDDHQAVALGVQGLSAWHLLRTCARIVPGESVVVHAAAGGVGSLLVQLAKLFGAGRVVAAASSPDKRAFAMSVGADAAVDGTAEGYRDRVVEANDGRPVDIVFDATGGAVFDAALDALAPLGRIVTYGVASHVLPGPITAAQVIERTVAVGGFWLPQVISLPGRYREPLAELFALTAAGRLRPAIGGVYPLGEARRAHEDMLGRRTRGKLVLEP